MTGRTAKAHVRVVGSGLAEDHGLAGHDVAGVEAEEEGGAAEEVFAVDEEEEVINADHGQEAAPDFVNTRGFVFNDGEFTMMELILTIQDGYIGPHFVHRLTPTNIVSKLMKTPKQVAEPLNLDPEGVLGLCMGVGEVMLMKTPKQVAEPLNLDPEGVLGLCMGVGEVMQVVYHTDRDRRIVFNKEWGAFVAQNHLQVGDAVVFNFRETNAQHMNLICVVNALRVAEP